VGYAGTRGVHLLAFHDFNAPIPTITNGVMTFVHPDATNPNQLDQNARPNPNFGALDMLDTTSYSSYNALQVGLSVCCGILHHRTAPACRRTEHFPIHL
jgi:hypothetical protein